MVIYKFKKLYKEIPCNEEDLALLDILIGGEVEIEDGVTALIGGEGGFEGIVGFIWAAQLVHHHLIIFDFVGDETVVPLRF